MFACLFVCNLVAKIYETIQNQNIGLCIERYVSMMLACIDHCGNYLDLCI